MKEKQGEMKGMPEKTELGKEAEFFMAEWEKVKDAQNNLNVVKERLMPLMKKERVFSIAVQDSLGKKRKIEYNENESITVKTEKK